MKKIEMMNATTLLRTTATGFILCALNAIAAPVVVTPGSMAGYTYYPPAVETGSGTSNPPSGEQDSLQRCLWAPTSGDRTVQVTDEFDYGKEVKLYYRMVGGNGGSGTNGGGGGSSAILKNGALSVIANGADGGTTAQEKSGFLLIKKGDTLRFITGGGGGAGYFSSGRSIGGGGGAGYMGGGGGASHSGSSITATGSENGKGGTNIAGEGGFSPGMWPGTPGASLTGGISTFTNGNTAPTTGSATSFTNYTDWNSGYSYFYPMSLRTPAGTNQGGMMGDMSLSSLIAGSGGGLGNGGAGTFETSGKTGHFSGPTVSFTIRANCSLGCNYTYVGSTLGRNPPHNEDMKLTRSIVTNTSYGSYDTSFSGASLGGQIIAMYQAPTCGFLK